MVDIQAISYQTSAAYPVNLAVTDQRFAKAALKIAELAQGAFNIQDGTMTASITADRITIAHNGHEHILSFTNDQLTANGRAVQENQIYSHFGYLQGLLKITTLPIAQIAQSTLAPTITRSPDGNTVNITLNMGHTLPALDSGRHVQELTNLLKSTFETALGSQQQNIQALTEEKSLLNELVPNLQQQIAELTRQQRDTDERHRRELEQLKAKTEANDQALRQQAANALALLSL